MRRLLMVAVLALGALATLPAAAEAQCVNAAQARRAIAAGKAIPLSVALQQAGISAQVVRVALCRKGGHAVYELGVLDKKGRLRKVTIPAN
ncbi:MAG: hypothetical protein OEL78_00345 [Hyphomicrobiales bacterium]|nr:hypothetical protein [Hyphomicrobiales bacterium]